MAKQLLALGLIFAGQFWQQLLSSLLPSNLTTQLEFLKLRLFQSFLSLTYSLLAASLLPIARCFYGIRHRCQSYLRCAMSLVLARHPFGNSQKSMPTGGLQRFLARRSEGMRGYFVWYIFESSTPKFCVSKFLTFRELFLFFSLPLFEGIRNSLFRLLSLSRRLLLNAFSRRTNKHTAKQLFLLNRFLTERLVFRKHALLNP